MIEQYITMPFSYLLIFTFSCLAIRNGFKSKVYRRGWRSCAFFSCSGLLLLSIFMAIGSTVDENGILHEPFILLPLGGFMIIIGMIVASILSGLHLYRYIRNHQSAKI